MGEGKERHVIAQAIPARGAVVGSESRLPANNQLNRKTPGFIAAGSLEILAFSTCLAIY